MHGEADRRVDVIARTQHGVFSRRQALSAGLTRSMIESRLRASTWIRLDPSVYALASHPYTWERQLMAATLSVPGSVVSGRSAAALHRLDGFRPGRIDLVAPPGRNERSRLARVHRNSFVDATAVRGIPTLTVARTIVDLAATLHPHHLAEVIDRAVTSRSVDLAELTEAFVVHAAGRRPGTRALRELLSARSHDAPEPPTTELERLLRRMLDVPALPTFAFEVEMPWWPAGEGRVDSYAASCTLIVEADGRRWHTRERDFTQDRTRDNLAAAHGHGTLRFTYADLTRSVAACRATVTQTAVARGWRPSFA